MRFFFFFLGEYSILSRWRLVCWRGASAFPLFRFALERLTSKGHCYALLTQGKFQIRCLQIVVSNGCFLIFNKILIGILAKILWRCFFRYSITCWKNEAKLLLCLSYVSYDFVGSDVLILFVSTVFCIGF